MRPADKQRLLKAMTTTVLADGRVAVAELELLRTICATLRTCRSVQIQGPPACPRGALAASLTNHIHPSTLEIVR
ncbi:MAG: TerB family tellurite resistance protein [Thermochromatium sp.]